MVDEIGYKPPVTVETLSGYGKVKDWVLDLKADLDDYRAGILAWSKMSTSCCCPDRREPARRLLPKRSCNSLQVPLVVTSVSTWLQGGHLNDVIDKMNKTFVEARAMAPANLFIDEIDEIGKRRSGSTRTIRTPLSTRHENCSMTREIGGIDHCWCDQAPKRYRRGDQALRAAGRHFETPKPNVPTLAEILALHLGDDVMSLIQESVPDVGSESDDGFSLKKIVADHLKEEAEEERKGAVR
ncbi:hypothetical protein HDIA_0999 [Hartmannibacter diazotrophicus]|uniref:ATPase AAA-type core domain-containing protein n=1 Tax=Hartmannibacter diazotrophicus TaxID=1482074 RepID=A0A2C9D2Q2_9HYPH|nr:AAA family ATPase [Hartmannibacter diazotrophicus]SON54540.1 hypothetical protein HDIA_0999 [Hartmannibacter diazotrophicus]